eukprot:CAMPEP_0197549014 /NCGR_PEP_ID=MMETSP1320-20131121/3009_1 /TAXON_ID=91990 /ORGANISM="Bolidomonas sp., Strain RCC2347" /LENGTH=230 /DNA_ID=CAMNT_0043109147 /DNA_START=255 /DNA_END=943 /DNA_ORIENTATION=-
MSVDSKVEGLYEGVGNFGSIREISLLKPSSTASSSGGSLVSMANLNVGSSIEQSSIEQSIVNPRVNPGTPEVTLPSIGSMYLSIYGPCIIIDHHHEPIESSTVESSTVESSTVESSTTQTTTTQTTTTQTTTTIVASIWRIPYKSIASCSRLYFHSNNVNTILIKPLLTVPGMTVSPKEKTCTNTNDPNTTATTTSTATSTATATATATTATATALPTPPPSSTTNPPPP